MSHRSVLARQKIFGYTEEELRVLVTPMAASGAEGIGSMGTDTPEAVLSTRPRLIFDYFSQLFAQVTNPPLDAIREAVVTSLSSVIGPEANLLEPGPWSCRQIVLPFPVLDNDDLAKLMRMNAEGNLPGFASAVISGLYDVGGGAEALAEAIERCRPEADEAIAAGARVLMLSDRHSTADRAPIPSLLLTSAVHQHLVRQKSRTKVALVVESGDAREVHHIALLLGYGAGAVNPYLVLESAEDLARHGLLGDVTPAKAIKNTVYALGKGVLKVMSKMGISTVGSYRGAQVFAVFGIDQDVLDEYFTGSTTRTGGSGLGTIAADVAERHALAFVPNPRTLEHRGLEIGGQYQWRREGEIHLFNPETVYLLQHSTRSKQEKVFRRYTDAVDKLSREGGTLRGLFELRTERAARRCRWTRSNRRRRSSSGSSPARCPTGPSPIEAHQTLAIAMNRLGGKSNTGEGGEDVERLLDPVRRSAIKQVASGRFGVTSAYLVNSSEIQIKMAQGAKPGEGGQLPGSKVYPWIAATRHATAGVGLISPPPHHDIYSIEDLKQLIHDLRNANPAADVSVKLVSVPGVGTVAAGVTKAHADKVIVAGNDGGTGAAPLTSLKHTGQPWELGLAETQQTLRLNRLREQVKVQVDGGLKTAARRHRGRAARRRGVRLLHRAAGGGRLRDDAGLPPGHLPGRHRHPEPGAARALHRHPGVRRDVLHRTWPNRSANTLRPLASGPSPRPSGTPRCWTSRTPSRTTGPAGSTWRRCWRSPTWTATTRCTHPAQHDLSKTLDAKLIELAAPALQDARGVRIDLPIRNVDRTAGTMLGSEVTRVFGPDGLPDHTIDVNLTGTAGQSLGAFLPPRGLDHPARRRQRLRRQGPVRRPDRGPAGRELAVAGARGEDPGDRRQHHRLRRHLRRDLPARPGGRAVRRPQLRCADGHRGHRRPRLRVHDRRPGGHPGPDRAQRRRRDERRHRLPARPGTGQGEPGTGRPRVAGHRRGVLARRGDQLARQADRIHGWPPRCSPTGRSPSVRFSRVMPRDYRRVLSIRAEAAALGVDADEMIMEASHG